MTLFPFSFFVVCFERNGLSAVVLCFAPKLGQEIKKSGFGYIFHLNTTQHSISFVPFIYVVSSYGPVHIYGPIPQVSLFSFLKFLL